MDIYRQLPPYNVVSVPPETWAGADPDLMYYLATGKGADKIVAPENAAGFPELTDAERQFLTGLGWTAMQIQEFDAEICA